MLVVRKLCFYKPQVDFRELGLWQYKERHRPHDPKFPWLRASLQLCLFMMGSKSEVNPSDPSKLDRSNDLYIKRSIHDLFSLGGRVTVITGGARGIGLALAFAVAEAGSDVAILDILNEPHEHFWLLQKSYGVKVHLYK